MKIKVLFFGILTDVVKENRLEVSVEKNMADLERKLIANYPALQKYAYQVFVNKELASGNKLLKDGDEVAFLPPFAGG